MPNILSQDIARETGVIVRGSIKKLTSYGIIHAFDTHGNHQKESERGQIGIKDEDFDLIPDIITSPDSFERGNDKKSKKAVVFIKKINERIYHVVMSVTKETPTAGFVFNTMYIKK